MKPRALFIASAVFLASVVFTPVFAQSDARAVKDIPAYTVALPSLGPVRLGDTIPWFAAQVGGKVMNRSVVLREAQAKGNKGVVLAFFATWCVPCRVGLKMLGDNQERLEAQGIGTYLVDASQTGKSPDGFLRELGAHRFPVLPDPYGIISRDFGMVDGESLELALPKTFLVSTDGRLRAIFAAEGKDYVDRILRGN